MRTFDFDLFVIGGGSGGVRAARMSAQRGARVGLAECAELGGTCVNVGCIPKKLYSYAAGYAESFEEAAGFGWQLGSKPHFDWNRLKANRAREITRLNGVYRSLLEAAGVRDGRLHDARHTAATVLLILGVPDAVVDRIMGWEPGNSARMRRHYQHLTGRVLRDTAAKVGGLLWPVAADGGAEATGAVQATAGVLV